MEEVYIENEEGQEIDYEDLEPPPPPTAEEAVALLEVKMDTRKICIWSSTTYD